ncbi:hypothetical protein M422DRAFT_168098 [Sphaerobolus stellatus SS14]|uniref:HAT C-terminal dimerisation domain-containing protein n=1 Tax=Sphaerobolus stellatus (strain SS14) TaxID=990650 RepID=A0A0C9VC11_SPHS4|nr:hypothetical protein M422DRAFT_168098 [Sphaerobolus stellatus SS14]
MSHLLQQNSDHYPTLFNLALDILPTQGSSVPAERAFFSNAETDTKRHNCISPMLMEEL